MSKPDLTPKFMLMAMAFLGPIALNAFAPLMPTLKQIFSSSTDTIQLGMTLFLLIFAVSQLTCGLVVELFGQRRVLLVGVGLYIIGSLLVIFAQDVVSLLLARILQAIGGGVSLLLTRTIIMAQNQPNKAAEKLSYVTLGVATVQATVPTISGYLNVNFSWQVIFYLSLMLAIIAWLSIYRYLPNSAKQSPSVSSKLTKLTVNAYLTVFKSPGFVYFTFANAFISAAFFVFVVNAPFIVNRVLMGNSYDYGKWYLFIASGFWLGSLVGSQTSSRFGSLKMMKLGWLIGILAAISMLIGIQSIGVSYVILFVTMGVFTFGRGLFVPNAQAAAVSLMEEKRAMAMGIFSFIQFALGATVAHLSGVLIRAQSVLLPFIICLLVIGAFACYVKATSVTNIEDSKIV